MTDLTQMTVVELKHYLSENRSDNDKFSAALAELLQRDPNPVIYSRDMPLEEQERLFMEKIVRH
jgi:hypothetical protein